MIARVWTARAKPDGADAYQAHFGQHVLPAIQRIQGCKGATLLRRSDGDDVELIVISLWVSEDALREFAGPDVSRAMVGDAARHVLTSFDTIVRHFTVVT
jgi:heme-degrading monooxygenase HmoA